MKIIRRGIKGKEELLKSGIIFKKGEKNGK